MPAAQAFLQGWEQDSLEMALASSIDSLLQALVLSILFSICPESLGVSSSVGEAVTIVRQLPSQPLEKFERSGDHPTLPLPPTDRQSRERPARRLALEAFFPDPSSRIGVVTGLSVEYLEQAPCQRCRQWCSRKISHIYQRLERLSPGTDPALTAQSVLTACAFHSSLDRSESK